MVLLVSFLTCQVDPKSLPILSNWKPVYDIEKVLSEIRKEMASAINRRTPQPPEGSTY